MGCRFFLPLICIVILATSWAARPCKAAPATLTLGATVLSKNQCRFLSNNITLDFGTLSAPFPNVTASTTVNFRCQGADPIAFYEITPDDGLNFTGPGARRMQSTTDASQFLPYGLSFSPLNGSTPKNATQTLTISGTVLGTNYQTVFPGVYEDTVVISILP